jgi:imidazolonepropionase
VLTLRGSQRPRCGSELNELSIIQDGALLIRDGILVEVGSTRRIENLAQARGATEINAAGRVVMPGFIDSHTHLLFPPSGATAGDLESGRRVLRATNAQRLEVRARGHLQAMARHGTTTVEIKTGCGLDPGAENKALRILSELRRDAIDVFPVFQFRLPCRYTADCREQAISMINTMLPKIRRRRLARAVDIAWSRSGCDREPIYRHFLVAARGMGFHSKVHAGGDDLASAATCAVENFCLSIDHADGATPEVARLLAGSCTMATLLPCAGLHRGQGPVSARPLIDGGVPVAIGTNFNPVHTPALNMQTAVALGCMWMGMTAEEAIIAATINGAHALGCADRVGSLEPGKLADLVILNIPDYRELAREFGVNLVQMTMKRGDLIYQEGEVATRDAEWRGNGLRGIS